MGFRFVRTKSMAEYIVEIETLQGGSIKTLVDALKELLTDTCITFDDAGMRISTMDRNHILLVHLRLHADRFETYRCERETSIGLNVLLLHKITKSLTGSDVVQLRLDGSLNHLEMVVTNAEKASRTCYRISLIDVDSPQIEIADASGLSEITLPSAELSKLVRDMRCIGDFVEIVKTPEALCFNCAGEFCELNSVLDIDEASRGDQGGVEEVIQGVFSLNYLCLFSKCSPLSSTVKLYLKNEYPLVVQYDVSSLGSIKLCLSPQVESSL